MAYQRVHKSASSWNPAFHQDHSESRFKPRPFSIQPEHDTEESEQQEIPAYSRADRDAISAKLLESMGRNIQTQTEAQVQKSSSEPEELDSEEMSNETQTLQRLSGSAEAGADDDKESNGGTLQRLCDKCESEQQGQQMELEDSEQEMSPLTGAIQRQEESSQEEEDKIEPVQTKLVVGAPGDKYEQEADFVAEQVMSMEAPTANPQSIQRQSEEEKEQVQRSPLAASITPLIQRVSEEDVQTKPSVQRAEEGGAFQGSSSLESRLSSQKGGGSPLEDEVKSFMEPRFGNDFSSVRIHTGGDAVQMNKELHAQAFTHGSDVYFNEGKYNPGSNEGKQLLAHELTHVVQQTGKDSKRHSKNAEVKSPSSRLTTDKIPLIQTIPGDPFDLLGAKNDQLRFTQRSFPKLSLPTVCPRCHDEKPSGIQLPQLIDREATEPRLVEWGKESDKILHHGGSIRILQLDPNALDTLVDDYGVGLTKRITSSNEFEGPDIAREKGANTIRDRWGDIRLIVRERLSNWYREQLFEAVALTPKWALSGTRSCCAANLSRFPLRRTSASRSLGCRG